MRLRMQTSDKVLTRQGRRLAAGSIGAVALLSLAGAFSSVAVLQEKRRPVSSPPVAAVRAKVPVVPVAAKPSPLVRAAEPDVARAENPAPPPPPVIPEPRPEPRSEPRPEWDPPARRTFPMAGPCRLNGAPLAVADPSMTELKPGFRDSNTTVMHELIVAGLLFTVSPGTLAGVLEQQDGLVRLRIEEGPKRGRIAWARAATISCPER